MGTVLNPILSSTAGTSRAYNPGIAETYSWIPVEGDVLGRPLYARASYITNFSDMSIHLSASELSIGAVTLKDNNSGLNADVVGVPGYGAGLQVLTQDLESSIDDITIGDKEGHYASVDPLLSSLQVKVTNSYPITYAQDSGHVDAFGRLRASMPTTLFDSKTLHNKQSLFWSQAASSGASVYFTSDLNDASVTLSATGSGQYAIRQTTQRFNYQPGKCVWSGSYITLADGKRVKAKDLVGKTFELLTLNEDGKIIKKKAIADWNAFEPIFKIKTKTGNEVIRNSKHPFWVGKKTYKTFWKAGNKPSIQVNGWTELKDISKGSLIAVTERLDVFGNNNTLSIDDAKILGYLIGDGSIIKSISFTQKDNKQLAEFKEIVKNKNHRVVYNGNYGYRVVKDEKRNNKPNYFIELLKKQNILGHRAWEKHVPNDIFNSPKDVIVAFLSRLYSTDGWASNREIGLTSVSEQLILDVKELLLKFGIHGHIASITPKLNNKLCRKAYTLFLYGKQDIEKFASEIGIYGKEVAVEKVLQKVLVVTESTKQNFKYKELPNTLRWDIVESVEYVGEDWTVAIEVEETHTYLTSFYEHNSQLAIFTGILNPVTNAKKRYGLFQSLTAAPFEPNVGLYFETQTDSPSSIAVVQQNDGFLVPSVSARRENWNIDKLDGTGPSGKVLNLSAANIFLVDYEWLGVGRVRFGTVIDGAICYCHAINNAGNVQGAYIRTPNLPVRAEVRQTGAGTASMKIICSSVMSEGGADFTGVTKAVDSGDYPGLTIAAGARRAILGVRLQPTKLDSVNEVINASIIAIPQAASNQASFHYELLHNPTLSAGGTWQDVDANSNFQYWNGPTNPGGVGVGNQGTVIASGYGAVGSSVDLSNSKFEKFLRMGCSINGVRDELYLVVTPLENNAGVYGAMTFLESD